MCCFGHSGLEFFSHIGHHTENLTPCGGGMPWNVGSGSLVPAAADEPEGPSPGDESEGPSAFLDDEPEGSAPADHST